MKECGNCKYFQEYEGVCTNGKSDNVAEFMSKKDTCKWWVDKEAKDEQPS